MPLFLIRLLALGIIGYFGSAFFKSDKKFQITSKSNCDDAFKQFNLLITICPEKVVKLRRAHNTIRKKITDYFNKTAKIPVPSFFIQGSYKTKTIIENSNTLCDIDLGVFFSEDPGVYPDTLQNHIKKALNGHTSRGVEIKTNCVRLNYVSDFHIDLPIYYQDKYSNKIYFGRRGHHWEQSDPKEFVNWFRTATYGKPQLVRIIRYLKAWADKAKTNSGRKLPSGLALTLWAIEFYESSKRDDIAFFKTSIGILNYLSDNFKGSWTAEMPVEPYDNVLDRLNSTQKSFFYNEFKEMISISADAVSASSKSEALKNWKQIFGYRFK